jgi:hypothetical protein
LDGILITIRYLIYKNKAFFLNGGITKLSSSRSLYYYRFSYFYLFFADYTPNKVNKNFRIQNFLFTFSVLSIAFGLSKKRFFSSGNFNLGALGNRDSEDMYMLASTAYNINPQAGNSQGYKDTTDSIDKICSNALGTKHSDQVKKLTSESRKGINNKFEGQKDSKENLYLFRNTALTRTKDPKAGIEVKVRDIETNLTISYTSIRKAAKAINSNIKSLSRREKSGLQNNTLYKGRYMI